MGSTPTTARYNLCFNIILPIVFSSISCNKLHATRALFHIVACILMHEWFHLSAWFAIPYLMHDRTTHKTLFTPFEHLQFRATSCTLRWFAGCRAVDFLSIVWVLREIKWCGIAKVVPQQDLKLLNNSWIINILNFYWNAVVTIVVTLKNNQWEKRFNFYQRSKLYKKVFTCSLYIIFLYLSYIYIVNRVFTRYSLVFTL